MSEITLFEKWISLKTMLFNQDYSTMTESCLCYICSVISLLLRENGFHIFREIMMDGERRYRLIKDGESICVMTILGED